MAPNALVPGIQELLERSLVDVQGSPVEDLAPAVRVLGAREAKGLEFDHVVLAEPAGIVDEADGVQGRRHLYVALTARRRASPSCTRSRCHGHEPSAAYAVLGGEIPDGEAAADQRPGDVVDRHGTDAALERPGMCVAVQDEVRLVSHDRAGEPFGAEKVQIGSRSPTSVLAVGE